MTNLILAYLSAVVAAVLIVVAACAAARGRTSLALLAGGFVGLNICAFAVQLIFIARGW